MKINTNLINTSINHNKTNKQISNNSEYFNKILNKNLNQKQDRELLQACQQLESVFLNKVLDSMRSTIPKSDIMGNSYALEVFNSMLYEEYSKEMSRNGSIGIADILYKQLNQKV